VTTAPAPILAHAPARLDLDRWSQRLAVLAVLALLATFVLGPLLMIVVRSVTDDAGAFVGLRNFAHYLRDAGFKRAAWNTVLVGVVTAAVTVSLAFPYAYAVARSRAPLRKLFLVLGLLPLYAPTMLYGISLVYLFGNQGLLTHGLFGRVPLRVDIHLYGPTGIVLAEVLATFPIAVLVLVVSLSQADQRLYDAAASLGASAARQFWAVTLPGCRLGLLNAAAVAFIFATTDFGAPQVLEVSKDFPVLATDVFAQVIGLQDFSAGAAVSLVLLVPAAIACGVDALARRCQSAALSARSVPLAPARRPMVDGLLFAYCGTVAVAILVVSLAPLFVSLVRNWPYSLSDRSLVPGSVFTLAHFDFDQIGDATGGGMSAYAETLEVAVATAVVGTAVAFLAAYLVEKTRVLPAARSAARVLAVLPLGLPGLVLGLSFAMLFGRARFGQVPNPLAALYGTAALLVACNVVHFLGVAYLTAAAALRQLDAEFELVAASLGTSSWRLLARVTLPVCMPALLEIATYFFVSATTTISAVIFLQSASTPLASVAVITLADAGKTQPAAAMAALVLAGNVVARAAVEPVARFARRRTSRWTRPAT
jgi:iron(III) transport system permease protein